ncbi:MAG TPA: mycothiol system anti-sigma-R factor [Dermatophilaceae bacterium]|nr:mycothiol system anti-sigma-R factor [Dermatophilaceae bacterium]
MSCGSDNGCADVLRQAYEYLDGELDPADGERIRAHLEECRPCLREFDVDLLLKQLVRRSCGLERAPVALRNQILALITTEVVAQVRTTVAGGRTVTRTHVTTVRISDQQAAPPTER